MTEKKRVLLDIAPRKQWENGHGYCGETSIQSIGITLVCSFSVRLRYPHLFAAGLYYGCWISQRLVRSINQGEFLVTDDGNDANTLTRLLFDFERWPFEDKDEPQFEGYCAWLKAHLLQGHPCIITTYLDDVDDKSDEYDHIMPAVGIQYSGTKDSYDPTDVLLFHNLFDLTLLERQLSTNDMIKTRDTCKDATETGGCIPERVDYGYAIVGIRDEQRATLPVRLQVDSSDEPNISMGAPPIMMKGTITVFNLEPQQDYVLLRYASHRFVPKSGDAQAFLRSRYHRRHEFRATGNTYTFVDPEKIPSKESTYYRCVPAKGIESLPDSQT